MNVNDRIRELGIEIPPPQQGRIMAPLCEMTNKTFITSGNTGKINGELLITGKLGAEVDIEQGRQCARQCILNLLGNIQHSIGDLNEIKQFVKMLGFIASKEDFHKQPEVMDAASQLLIDIFGLEIGKCARSAIGVNVLPGNSPVEIEIIFKIK